MKHLEGPWYEPEHELWGKMTKYFCGLTPGHVFKVMAVSMASTGGYYGYIVDPIEPPEGIGNNQLRCFPVAARYMRVYQNDVEILNSCCMEK